MAYNPILVRSEAEGDAETISRIIEDAFDDSNQVELLHRVREDPDFNPLLSVVAEQGNEIIGYTLYFEVRVQDGDNTYRAAQIAPIAVRPDQKNKGVGERLVRHGMQHCHSLGFDLVLVMGPVDYFARMDFVPANDHGFTSEIDLIKKDFLVRALDQEALGRFKGKVIFPDYFSKYVLARTKLDIAQDQLAAHETASAPKTYNPIIIRSEQPEDKGVITDIIQSAFKDADQLDLLFAVRGDIDFNPLLLVVAEKKGTIMGHAMYFEITIEDGKKKHKAIHIAQVAVAPDYQRQGVGERLVRHGLIHCQCLDFDMVLVVGPLGYFKNFDFAPAHTLGIKSELDAPKEDVLALAIGADADKIKGKAVFPSFFTNFIKARGRKAYGVTA